MRAADIHVGSDYAIAKPRTWDGRFGRDTPAGHRRRVRIVGKLGSCVFTARDIGQDGEPLGDETLTLTPQQVFTTWEDERDVRERRAAEQARWQQEYEAQAADEQSRIRAIADDFRGLTHHSIRGGPDEPQDIADYLLDHLRHHSSTVTLTLDIADLETLAARLRNGT